MVDRRRRAPTVVRSDGVKLLGPSAVQEHTGQILRRQRSQQGLVGLGGGRDNNPIDSTRTEPPKKSELPLRIVIRGCNKQGESQAVRFILHRVRQSTEGTACEISDHQRQRVAPCCAHAASQQIGLISKLADGREHLLS